MAKKKAKPAVKTKAWGTPPVQIRLTPDDKALIEEVRTRTGVPSLAAAIRYAIQFWKLHDGALPKKRKEKAQ